MEGKKIWNNILSGVRSQVSHSTFKTWFSGSYVLDFKEDTENPTLIVALKNSFLKEQVEARYKPVIKKIIDKLPRPERSRYSSLSLHERADTPELGSMYSLSRIHPQTVNPQRSASEYNFKQNKFNLPKPMVSGDNFDFSFSGIKTAVVNLSKKFSLSFQDKTEIAYKFQEAVCEVLVKKTHKAASKYKVRSIVAGGGVAANSELRSRMSDPAKNGQLSIFFPEKELSIDNGAMIAVCAYYLSKKEPPLFLKADPSLHF